MNSTVSVMVVPVVSFLPLIHRVYFLKFFSAESPLGQLSLSSFIPTPSPLHSGVLLVSSSPFPSCEDDKEESNEPDYNEDQDQLEDSKRVQEK
jgi:hypothetical protein